MYRYGSMMLLEDKDVARDPVNAKLYLIAAVARGHERAIDERKTWTQTIEDSLFSYYETQALARDVDAQRWCGEALFEGKRVPQDLRRAAAWYRLAADLRDAESEFKYGMALLRGTGVAQDFRSARVYLERAAAQGHIEAKAQQGSWSREIDRLLAPRLPAPPRFPDLPPPGSGLTSPRSPSDKDLADRGNSGAQYRYAKHLIAQERFDEANDYLRKAIAQGHVGAAELYSLYSD